MDVEMGTFIPLVFGTNGGMGRDCQDFLRTLANKLRARTMNPTAALFPGYEYSFFICYLKNCTQMCQRL